VNEEYSPQKVEKVEDGVIVTKGSTNVLTFDEPTKGGRVMTPPGEERILS
jgi:hypothetical protein